MIEEIFKKRQEVASELRKLDEAIRALRAICEHDFISIGHDSHKEHYECTICKQKEYV